jgi:hypothetical protein
MRLKLISEIQYKFVSTNLARATPIGALAGPAINDLYHMRYQHLHKSKAKIAKSKL